MGFYCVFKLLLFCFVCINKFDVLYGSDVPHTHQDDSIAQVLQMISDLSFDISIIEDNTERNFAAEALIRSVLSVAFYLSKLNKLFGNSESTEKYNLLTNVDTSIETHAIISQSQFLIPKSKIDHVYSIISSFTGVDFLNILEKAYDKGVKFLLKEIDSNFDTIIDLAERGLVVMELFSILGISSNLKHLIDVMISVIPEIIYSSKDSIRKYRRMDQKQFNQLFIETSSRPELSSNAYVFDKESIQEKMISNQLFYFVEKYRSYLSSGVAQLNQEELALTSEYFRLYHDTELTNEEIFFYETIFYTMISLAYFLCFNAIPFNHPFKTECITNIFQFNIEVQEVFSERSTNFLIDYNKLSEIRKEVQNLFKVENAKNLDISSLSMSKSFSKEEVISIVKDAYKLFLTNIQLFKSFESKFCKVRYLENFFHKTVAKLEFVCKLILDNLKQINNESPESSCIIASLDIKKESLIEKLSKLSDKVQRHVQNKEIQQKRKEKKKRTKTKVESKYPTMTEEQAQMLNVDKELDKHSEEDIKSPKQSKSKLMKKAKKLSELQVKEDLSQLREEIKHVKLITKAEGASERSRRQVDKRNKNENKKILEKLQREARMQKEVKSKGQVVKQGFNIYSQLSEILKKLEDLLNEEIDSALAALIDPVLRSTQENLSLTLFPERLPKKKSKGLESVKTSADASSLPLSKEQATSKGDTISTKAVDEKVKSGTKSRSKSMPKSRSRSRSKSKSSTRKLSKSRSRSRPRSRSRSRSKTSTRAVSRSGSSSDSDSNYGACKKKSTGEIPEGVESIISKFSDLALTKHSESESDSDSELEPESISSALNFYKVSYPDCSIITQKIDILNIYDLIEKFSAEISRLHHMCSLLSGKDFNLIKDIENEYIKEFVNLLMHYNRRRAENK